MLVVFLLTLVAITPITECALAVFLATVDPKYPGKCVLPTAGVQLAPGETYTNPGCLRISCLDSLYRQPALIVEYASCGKIAASPGCSMREEKDLPYPKCCPYMVCEVELTHANPGPTLLDLNISNVTLAEPVAGSSLTTDGEGDSSDVTTTTTTAAPGDSPAKGMASTDGANTDAVVKDAVIVVQSQKVEGNEDDGDESEEQKPEESDEDVDE